jgi:hypothetical protein
VKTQTPYSTKHLIKEIPGISVFDLASFSNFPAIDPWRLTIGFWQLGLSGYEADEILCRDHGIICELVGTQSLTFVINLGTSRDRSYSEACIRNQTSNRNSCTNPWR